MPWLYYSRKTGSIGAGGRKYRGWHKEADFGPRPPRRDGRPAHTMNRGQQQEAKNTKHYGSTALQSITPKIKP